MRGTLSDYVPAGPCEVAKVRGYAEAKLREVSGSAQLLNDKTRFMDYMERLTNDILGVNSERSSATARVGSALASAPASSSSSASAPEYQAAQPISADLREPSYSSLSKLQSIRHNVAALLGGGDAAPQRSPGRPAAAGGGGGGGAAVRGTASSPALQRQARGQLLRPHVAESNSIDIASEYPFAKAAAAGRPQPASPLRETKENETPLNRGAPPSSFLLDVNLPAAPEPQAASSAQADAPAAGASNAPRMEDGELDFSGTWKSAKGERRRYVATVDTRAATSSGGADSSALPPQTTITLRGSVDLSGISLEGLKSLTGHY